MESFILQIAPFVEQYGILGVFLLSMIEEVVTPVPSSVVLMAAGFFLLPALGTLKATLLHGFFYVVLPASAGLTLGALILYSLAFIGGEPLIKAWGKRVGLSWSAMERWRDRFMGGYKDELVVFGLRAFPVVPNSLISIACGLVRYSTKSFILFTFLGSVVRALVMGFLGWSVGAAYLTYAERFSDISLYVLWGAVGLAALILISLAVRRWVRGKNR